MINLVNIDSLSDSELIDFVRNDLAEEYLRQNMIDWKDEDIWIKSVS